MSRIGGILVLCGAVLAIHPALRFGLWIVIFMGFSALPIVAMFLRASEDLTARGDTAPLARIQRNLPSPLLRRAPARRAQVISNGVIKLGIGITVCFASIGLVLVVIGASASWDPDFPDGGPIIFIASVKLGAVIALLGA